MIELGLFQTKDGHNYYGHYYPENNLVEAVGPLPVEEGTGARGISFKAPATSTEDARNKILNAIKEGTLR